MFSIDFGHNTSQIWLLNFGITTLIDALFKDVAVAILLGLLITQLPRIKEECQKRKKKYLADNWIPVGAVGMHVGGHSSDRNVDQEEEESPSLHEENSPELQDHVEDFELF